MDHVAISTFVLAFVMIASGREVAAQHERTVSSGLFQDKPGRRVQTPEIEANVTSNIASTMNSTKNIQEHQMNDTTRPSMIDMGSQITIAISQFKAQPHDRRESARTLLPLLKTGTPTYEVEAMLGIPNAKILDYTLFYSSTLVVRFDIYGKVTKVSSDLLNEVRLAGTREKEKTDPEIIEAISEFKGQPYNRQKPAKKLLLLIKTDMPMSEVEAMLGPPDGTRWDYSLLNSSSSSLIVRFSTDGKVEKVTAAGLSEGEGKER